MGAAAQVLDTAQRCRRSASPPVPVTGPEAHGDPGFGRARSSPSRPALPVQRIGPRAALERVVAGLPQSASSPSSAAQDVAAGIPDQRVAWSEPRRFSMPTGCRPARRRPAATAVPEPDRDRAGGAHVAGPVEHRPGLAAGRRPPRRATCHRPRCPKARRTVPADQQIVRRIADQRVGMVGPRRPRSRRACLPSRRRRFRRRPRDGR
jgi:hypothetical protein